MRVVSWVVVASSVLWLMTYSMWPSINGFSLPPVSPGEVTGTVLKTKPNPPSNLGIAERYTAAWNSGDPTEVAAFYADNGTITINDGEPANGLDNITGVASGFMTAFPDIELVMIGFEDQGDYQVFHWALTGTHAETGQPVHITGSETWRLAPEGLILESRGAFDAEEYDRQVANGYRN